MKTDKQSSTVVVSRELLEKALKADASLGANGMELHEGWLAMKVLRALLAAAPQPPALGGEDDFWTWLDSAYRGGSKGEHAHFTKYNMEVAYSAGRSPLLAEIDRQKARADGFRESLTELNGIERKRDAALAERDTLKARCEAMEDTCQIAKKLDKAAFAKGTCNVDVGLFKSLAYALQCLEDQATPAAEDGE